MLLFRGAPLALNTVVAIERPYSVDWPIGITLCLYSTQQPVGK